MLTSINGGLIANGVRLIGVEILFPYPQDTRGRIWIPLNNGPHVLYGKNGVGKSTIVSALNSAFSGIAISGKRITVDLFLEILDDEEIIIDNSIEDDEVEMVTLENGEKIEARVVKERNHLQTGLINALINAVPHASFWREFQDEKYYFADADEAFREFQSVAETAGMRPPQIDVDQYFSNDWSNKQVTLEDAIRCMLTWQISNDLRFWSDEDARPHQQLVGTAFEEIAKSKMIKLSPVGKDAPMWTFAPVGVLDGSMPNLSQLMEIQNSIITAELNEYRNKYSLQDSTEIPDEYLSECQESEYLSEVFPSQAFAYSAATSLNQVQILAAHPYIAAEGWSSPPELTMDRHSRIFNSLNLNDEFPVKKWVTECVSRDVGYEEWELVWTGKNFPRKREFSLESIGLASFSQRVHQIGITLTSLKTGLKGLRVELSHEVKDWLEGNPIALEAQIIASNNWVSFDRLSAAQQKSIEFAIRIDDLQSGNFNESDFTHTVIFGDEVDSGFHNQAINSLYRFLAERTSTCFIASHSPIALKSPWMRKIHVHADDLNTTIVSGLDLEGDTGDLAESLGIMVSDLLGLIRGVVFVEGEHDLVVILSLFDHIPGLQKVKDQLLIIPTRGHKAMPTASDSEIMLSYTTAEILVVVDNARNELLSDLRTQAMQMTQEGLKPSLIIGRLGLRELLQAASPEEKSLYQILERAIQKRHLYRVHFFGLSVHDVIMLFAPKSFGLNQTWSELEEIFMNRVDRSQNFKDFLRSQGAIISTEMVKSAINDIDGEWPNDLVRLSNVMTGLVESNAINEMF